MLFGTLALNPGLVRAEDASSTVQQPAVPAKTPSQAEAPANSPNEKAMLWSPEDGYLDISTFVDQIYGFVPLVMPITEPAIGYGLGGGLIFIDRHKDEEGKVVPGFGRPNLSGVGGMGTENGTWGVGAFDLRHWRKDTMQTQAAAIYASVNLDFYCLSDDSILKDHPLRYNLEPLGGFVQVKFRLGKTRFWSGLNYIVGTTQVRFDAPAATPGIPDHQDESHIGGLTPSFSYDTRDNIFTPLSGTFIEAAISLYSPNLGSDDEFQRGSLTWIQYFPVAPKWTLGVRTDAFVSAGDVPFYMRPYVVLRGAPTMRYQGESVAQIEAEMRWQFWKRYSFVGFGGYGVTSSDHKKLESDRSVTTWGAGFRYEIARKYGLHMGLDVAFGADEHPAIYIQFGSAWMRM
jgi:hypothetical protein